MRDPTTTAIEVQIAERDLLRAENVRLGTALVEAIVERDRLIVALVEAIVERDRLIVDNARLWELVDEACGELEDAGGTFATAKVTEILAALEKLKRSNVR